MLSVSTMLHIQHADDFSAKLTAAPANDWYAVDVGGHPMTSTAPYDRGRMPTEDELRALATALYKAGDDRALFRQQPSVAYIPSRERIVVSVGFQGRPNGLDIRLDESVAVCLLCRPTKLLGLGLASIVQVGLAADLARQASGCISVFGAMAQQGAYEALACGVTAAYPGDLTK